MTARQEEAQRFWLVTVPLVAMTGAILGALAGCLHYAGAF